MRIKRGAEGTVPDSRELPKEYALIINYYYYYDYYYYYYYLNADSDSLEGYGLEVFK